MTSPADGKPPLKKRATIMEVARLAGVSHQTVSRYLRQNGGLKPDTVARIDQAVQFLDYRPNLIARSMRTKRSDRIAVVLPELTSFVPTPVLRGASAVAEQEGYLLDVVSVAGGDAARGDRVVSLLESERVDGVLSLTPLTLPAVGRGVAGAPVMVLEEYDSKMRSSGYLADGEPAADIVRYLAGIGHRRFLHVAGSSEWTSARNRRDVYLRTIAEMGLESYGVVDGDWSVRSGYEAAQDLPEDSGVTAIIAANDYVALGVLRGLQDRGIDVPGDVSVFGWDDEQFGQYLAPSMSSVALDRETLGRQAMMALISLIRDEPAPTVEPGKIYRLVIRDSTAPARR